MQRQGVEPGPSLTEADAFLLAALTEGSYDGRPITLRDLVHDWDWVLRGIPTFDQVSFGVPRLIAAGYATVELQDQALALSATPKAIALRASVPSQGLLGDFVIGMCHAIRAGRQSNKPGEPEDRSLGRLQGLEPRDFEIAVRDYGAWLSETLQPFIEAGQAIIKRQGWHH